MILNGWKEIANHLGCSVRTVQRWEAGGLPVIRPVSGSRAHVIAYAQHLDRWLQRPTDSIDAMPHIQAEVERTQQLLLNLLQQRQQMCLRLGELRKELASLRGKHPKHYGPKRPFRLPNVVRCLGEERSRTPQDRWA